uniref:Uncharacterized protein n=1 Tax=Setaria viridis TaxID=4556 RepID=A0A4U6VHV4_SETVI|nr:hypothetical protein SEVIR_3G300300v2 [Setaria viridis]
MLKKFPEEDFIKEMVADLHDDEQETSTQDRTSLPSEQTVAKEAHIQSSIHEGNGNAATNFSQDPILTYMRTRRVKNPSLNRSESSRYPVYLLSLRNKGRIVAKEYVGIYVQGLENVDRRNKGHELIPRPIFDICTLIDMKKATSTNLKQLGDVTFQGRSEAAMERGARTDNEA